ncbi:MAG TPA: hypothetical protein VM120_10145, partial [Bryobacteraceae bacterium]|nr:hypothetical protein [Bryobacteraceae bacterium]
MLPRRALQEGVQERSLCGAWEVVVRLAKVADFTSKLKISGWATNRSLTIASQRLVGLRSIYDDSMSIRAFGALLLLVAPAFATSYRFKAVWDGD